MRTYFYCILLLIQRLPLKCYGQSYQGTFQGSIQGPYQGSFQGTYRVSYQSPYQSSYQNPYRGSPQGSYPGSYQGSSQGYGGTYDSGCGCIRYERVPVPVPVVPVVPVMPIPASGIRRFLMGQRRLGRLLGGAMSSCSSC
ncbi:hypothetical protein V3C99_014851 [Haemonchus contortus]|uniref:Uncharacterized protein n=1 Tax=Haemonchus contortus TaxID=6289 RepID=A0A7I5ECL2_HAECO